MPRDEPASVPPTQRTVWFSGRVQGVGFRHTTRQIARGCAVTGFVRNLPDGRVELVAQGAAAELDRFVAEIARVMQGFIASVEFREDPVVRSIPGFRVER